MTDTYGRLTAFSDVAVVPYSDLLVEGPDALIHRGGPGWPDFDRQDEARHKRAGQSGRS